MWSILIIVLFVLQIAVLIALAAYLVVIKNGLTATVISPMQKIIGHGKAIAQTGLVQYKANLEDITAAKDSVVTIAGSLRSHQAALSPDLPISYAKIASLMGTLRTVRNVQKRVFAPKPKLSAKKGTPLAVKPSAPMHPVARAADRLGLLPPAAKHFGTAVGLVRLAIGVRRAVKARQQG